MTTHRAAQSVFLHFGLLACACDLSSAPRDPLPVAHAAVATPDTSSGRAKSAEAPAAVALAEQPAPLTAGRELTIAAGVVRLGSATGTAFRNPAREADDVPVDVAAFAIDALPYPNDPAQPPLAGLTRDEAERRCRADQKRLCSELEWERACKGDENLEYPSTSAFDPAECAKPNGSCRTAFGVAALGTMGREWTSSDAKGGLSDPLRTAIVRGASREAAREAHRCAARDAATADSKSDSIVFRCCRGEPTPFSYPPAPQLPAFAERPLKESEARDVLAAMPETKELAASFRLFTSDERTKALAKAGHTRLGMAPWTCAERPIAWSPTPGEQLVLLTGDTPSGALLVAYYPLESGRALFAASMLMKDEHGAVLLATKEDTPSEVLFSTCWGCGGEGGAIQLGEDARVRILQR